MVRLLAGLLFAAAPAAAPQVDPNGFPAPNLQGWEKKGTMTTDATLAIEGPETTVEAYENGKGDRILRLSLHGVVWAYGVLPKGNPLAGYILRDPTCSRRLTEKWSPDAPFTAPDCAVKAKRPSGPSGSPNP